MNSEHTETTEIHFASGEILLVQGNHESIGDGLERARRGKGRLAVGVIVGTEPKEGGVRPADVVDVLPGPQSPLP